MMVNDGIIFVACQILQITVAHAKLWSIPLDEGRNMIKYVDHYGIYPQS